MNHHFFREMNEKGALIKKFETNDFTTFLRESKKIGLNTYFLGFHGKVCKIKDIELLKFDFTKFFSFQRTFRKSLSISSFFQADRNHSWTSIIRILNR